MKQTKKKKKRKGIQFQFLSTPVLVNWLLNTGITDPKWDIKPVTFL